MIKPLSVQNTQAASITWPQKSHLFFMVPQRQPQLAKQKYKKVQYSITFSLLCEYTPPPFEQNKYI